MTEIGAKYPLYFCGTPRDEPSCVPMRPNQYGGMPGPSDQDGDGIEDASDNCPTVFNPIRPMDNGAQIVVRLTVHADRREATIDFTGGPAFGASGPGRSGPASCRLSPLGSLAPSGPGSQNRGRGPAG